MTTNSITINKTEVSVKEYQGNRVVTFKDIDTVHGRPNGTARKRFNDNKERFIEGTDYFVRKTDEAKNEFNIVAPNGLTLITESGYLMLVKSFTDDLAWDVQRQLVNTYFRVAIQSNADTINLSIKQKRAEAMFMNAQARLLNAETRRLKILQAERGLSQIAVDTMAVKAAEKVTGQDLGEYLPKTEKTYSASEVGNALGISANKVGKIANAYGLKTEEYGVFVMDKSRYSSKEVTSFRYNEKGKDRIREILKEQ
jgi:hypothetical protein